MKAVIATIASLLIPGLGQLFYGKLFWAVGWFVLAWATCGLANVGAAIHTLFIAADGDFGSLAQ